MRRFLGLLLAMTCTMAWADPPQRKAKIGVAIVEPRFAAKEALFDLLLQGFFPVDIEYSE